MKAVTMAALLASTAAITPVLVRAQSAAPQSPGAATVGEIVVTAQRREQSILKVPLAVTAITTKGLLDKGVTNSAQLAQAVPNLQVNSAYGSTQPNFSLRGISVANEYNSNQASPIGVYMNDVYIAPRTSQGMGLYDLDRIEVLRGPQGTLFGRNTTGGAINFISMEPSLQGTRGYAQFGYGNFNTFTGQGAIETTLAGDQVGVRAAINVAEGDGEFKNVYPGGLRPDSTNSVQGRLSVRVKPDDSPLDVKIVAYGGRNDPTQAPVFGDLPYRQANFFSVDENSIGHFESAADGVSANIGYTLSPSVKLTSITSYDIGNENLVQAADGSPLNILDVDWKSQFHQVSEEARINYSSERLNLVGGLYYGADETATDNNFAIFDIEGFFQHFIQRRQSYAAFVQGDYNLTSKLVLTLGFRYTIDRVQYRDGNAYLYLGAFGGPETPVATTVPCPTPAGTCAFNPAARFTASNGGNAPTGRVALSYTFDDGVLIYASYNRGYRSGTFNGGSYTSSAGIDYVNPETVDAYEAGLKGRFLDNRLSLALAGFDYEYQNQQVQDLRAGPVGILVNAPKAQSYGGEAEVTFRATPDFSVNGSLGLVHAQYEKLTLQGVDLAGNDLPFAPHVTIQAGFDWRMFDIASGSLTLSPNVNYYSHQFFSPFDDKNSPGTGQMNSELQQPGYTLLNASLAWKKGPYVLRAWANNLTDAQVLGYGLDLRGAGFPFNFLVPDPPRTFGIEARYSF